VQSLPSLLPAPGDVLWIRHERWRVQRARRDRRVVRLDVTSRGRRATFLAPFDRPVPVVARLKLREISGREALARTAALIGRAPHEHTIASAIDADIELLPHQLEPALAIAAGARRLLVADDVGLGKTIQAGLVIAERTRRDDGSRVLVIVPAALREQWHDELRARFGLPSWMADRDAIDLLSRESLRRDDPWARPGIWIASADYLKQVHVVAALPRRPWDLVVIDEAHTACGDSDRHAICHEIGRRTRCLLLLTATPHDGDAMRFDRLMNLGRLPSIDDSLTVLRRTRADLHWQGRRRVRFHRVARRSPETRVLQLLAEYERAVIAAAGVDRREHALLLLSVLRKRALSTTAALVKSLERRIAWIGAPVEAAQPEWHQLRLGFATQDDDATDAQGALSPLSHDVGLDARDESAQLQVILDAARAAAERESKLERLAALLTRTTEPAVVFTEFRDSLEAAAARLDHVRPIAILHGGQSEGERRDELDRFVSGRATLLIATDVASLGLNLQAQARWVINLELPWNPARLEQRAGRVDRIGQRRTVHVTLLIARHPAEATLLEHLARRTMLARAAMGTTILAGAMPDRIRICEVLLGCAPEPVTVAVPDVTNDRSWTRRARAATRVLSARRRLASRWRARSALPTVTASADVSNAPSVRATASPRLFVFVVPIVDRAGEVAEEHIVGVRVPVPTPRRPHDALVDATTAAAGHACLVRARRISVFRTKWANRASAVELGLCDHLTQLSAASESQPGLFDRRALVGFDRDRAEVEEIRRRAADRIARYDECGALSVGKPQLVFVLRCAH